MEIKDMNIEQIELRKSEIMEEINHDDADLEALETEIRSLNDRKKHIEDEAKKREELRKDVASKKGENIMPVIEKQEVNPIEERAKKLVETGKTLFETRTLLSTGTLRPTEVKKEIGELPEVMSSIVDDVYAFDATGMGAYSYAYRATDSAAAAVTEGSAIGGTAGTFSTGTINPSTWGILDTISNQVKKMSPIAYENSVRRNAYLALRRKAKAEIVTTVLTNTNGLADTATISLDKDFVKNLVLGFNADESVAGGTKLYLCKEDLKTLGAVRGTNEKKALFDITFTDENNGTITEGGMQVKFSICSDLKGSKAGASGGQATNQMIYGQPQAIEMPMWDNYEIAVDEGGKYFETNMMAIRGVQTAGCAVTKKHAIQIIN